MLTLHLILDPPSNPRGEGDHLSMAGRMEARDDQRLAVPDEALRDLTMITHCLRGEGYAIVAYEFTSNLPTNSRNFPGVGVDEPGKTDLHLTVQLSTNGKRTPTFEGLAGSY